MTFKDFDFPKESIARKTRSIMNNQRILVVDDDKEFVLNLKNSFMEINSGYYVLESNDGRNALEILENAKIDILVLDVQIPELNGLQLLTRLTEKGIWLPAIVVTDSNINEREGALRDFGIVEFIKKNQLPEQIAVKIDEVIKQSEKKDTINNIGLPSILQLIEMDKRTGVLSIQIGKDIERLFFNNGKLMDIQVKGLNTEDSLEAFLQSFYEEREISIVYIDHHREKKVNMSLMQMVMEASRIKDEKKLTRDKAKPGTNKSDAAKNEYLQALSGMLNSFKEVERFVISSQHGEVLAALPKNYDEDILSASIYLWIVGSTFGDMLGVGDPDNLVCYFKAGKRFVMKHNDYVITIDLSDITKYSAFKEKLSQRLNKMGNMS
jgi:CheY-like chemotaxis protein